MDRSRALLTGPSAGWVGRILLLGAVVFWWGGVVVPNLVSLAFPAWLAPEAMPRDLNPDIDFEGRLANRVSAAALLGLTLVALAAAAASRRRAEGWVATGGWAALAGAAGVLTWEELSEFHVTALPAVARELLGANLVADAGVFVWVLVALPVVAGFMLAMGGLYFRGVRTRAVRAPLALGLAVWLLALLAEGTTPALTTGRAYALMVVLEETLELGGTLLLTLSAVAAWRPGCARAGIWRGGGLRAAVIASLLAVAVIGGLYAALAMRVPLVDARATGGHSSYWVSLADGQSVAQDFRDAGRTD